eukprot:1025267-Pleurochrysis_carterae.AAC.1
MFIGGLRHHKKRIRRDKARMVDAVDDHEFALDVYLCNFFSAYQWLLRSNITQPLASTTNFERQHAMKPNSF